MKSFVVYLAILFVTQAQEIAYYEDIKNLPNTPEILLIDVREPYEVEGTGLMPTAVNIPSAQVEWALSLIPPKFECLYVREKPQLNDPIIFSCKSGRRAQAAAVKAINLGFTNVKFYEGAWSEWCVMENLPCGE